ncbi:MAG: DUF6602 domain-containing protein [Pseudomonadota bacterium]
MSEVHDLHKFMSQITHEMSEEYQRIHARASDDPGTAGDEGEENWANLLRDWLPSNYHVATKGRLIGPKGELSPQVDVVVLKPSYPKKLLEKRVWLAGGVAAAFECKTTLKATHVEKSVARARQFKRLYAPGVGTPFDEMVSPLLYGLLAHSHSWQGDNSQPLENVNAAYNRAVAAVEHPRELLDTICISDVATWHTFVGPCYKAEWATESENLEKAFDGKWGPMSALTVGAFGSQGQSNEYTPIGALIAFTLNALPKGTQPSETLQAIIFKQT